MPLLELIITWYVDRRPWGRCEGVSRLLNRRRSPIDVYYDDTVSLPFRGTKNRISCVGGARSMLIDKDFAWARMLHRRAMVVH